MDEHRIARDGALALIGYLTETYVCDGCRGDPMLGCKSCQAIALIDQLHAWALEIEEANPASFA